MIENSYVRSIRRIGHLLDWLPSPLGSILVLVFAAGIALLSSRIITDALPRLPGLRRIQFIHAIIARLRAPIRNFLMIIAASAALQATVGFTDATTSFLEQVFICLFILNLGFGIIRTFRLLTDQYLTRISAREHADDITVRSHQTQIRVLRRLIEISFGVLTVASSLMVFHSVQKFGVSLFASAGAASLIVGLSARPALTNLIAGIQIAVTQPIRMEDMLILNGDWAWVEEINATYVVLRTWDRRRYIVPISYFLENPFQNWTHSSPSLIASLFLWLDYQTPVDRLREMYFEELAKCPDWDQDKTSIGCQIADSNAQVMSIRLIAGAPDANSMWDLACDIRERMLRRLRLEMPECLPRGRTAIVPGAPEQNAWPDALVAPPVNRPQDGPYRGPDMPASPPAATPGRP
ncbi:mechanosensitive ion channel family protein [Gluconobacter albidus]|uniref:mechanosensitive ion channel family protein n=1 Tax=Gluconobacter albidus TaxID=318683 RepID=UPI0020A00C1E|nr:mechanosensitive ion channel family protein [Gluconobacter albidus]MCP1273091.1 mechanosensitive ion channel family protein [Gluconobacter albidus]